MTAVLMLSAWLGREVLSSLAELTSGFRRFGAGSFGEPIRILSRDELGDVARQANQMASSLERLGEETRKAAARFQKLLEGAPDAMVIVDRGGRIVLVNVQAEKLFGYARAELLGQAVEILVPGGDAGKAPRAPRRFPS